MELTINKSIDRKTELALRDFTNECMAADPVSVHPLASAKEIAGVVSFILWEDDRILAILSAYAIDDDALEINAFTLPSRRRQGLFHRLYEELLSYYPPEKRQDITFQCDTRSKDVQGFLDAFGCEFEDTEYLLVCRDPKSHIKNDPTQRDPRILEMEVQGCGDRQLLAQIHSRVFDLPEEESREFIDEIAGIPGTRCHIIRYRGAAVGCFFMEASLKRAYIFGLGLVPEVRGKGLSDVVMRYVFRCVPAFCEEATVQVSKSNERADRLYRKFGFEEAEALSLYHMPEEEPEDEDPESEEK